MSSLPPLDVTITARKISCVLDGELALSRHGLLFATRLAREANIWLFRALWQALDNSFVFPGAEASRAEQKENGEPSRRFAASPCPRTIQQWESARLETDLGGSQFFFVGDARHESFLPKDTGNDIVERFEGLAVELETLFARTRGNGTVYDPVYECNRDTVALATALIRHAPIVLGVVARPGSGAADSLEPAICDFLCRCGIDCRRVDDDSMVASIKDHLRPIFARSGIAELIWDLRKDGLDLAVLHIVAPHAMVMPSETELDRSYGDASGYSTTEVLEPFWFHGACTYWWIYG
jgi:hypothetical protein